MDVRNCRKCGRIFNYVAGPPYCPACVEAQEAKFQAVKTYIREHPGCGVNEVSEECEVETSQIYQWLREERLQLGEGSMITLQCEGCGGPIQSGKFCEKCKREMITGLKQAGRVEKPVEAPKPDKQSNGNKMRFL